MCACTDGTGESLSVDVPLIEQAKAVATYLGLPLEIRATGYHLLETRLVEKLGSKTTNNGSL